mmetsp:Transcript_13018/g.22368  ORF Transcript_13018/g.22368 Transcript_13018/m.22368 type:complete len:111 (-) Transcript_13018:1215-1547(-)
MGPWRHVATQMIVATVWLILIASFVVAADPPTNMEKQVLLKDALKTFKYESNIPIHVQIAKRLTGLARSSHPSAPDTLKKPESHPTPQRDFIASRRKGPVSERPNSQTPQ